ncbi:MAG: hypothetical protein OXC07_07545 [Kistimonas sp.]|nr:hypothetical protein [Kistimonas sp.]
MAPCCHEPLFYHAFKAVDPPRLAGVSVCHYSHQCQLLHVTGHGLQCGLSLLLVDLSTFFFTFCPQLSVGSDLPPVLCELPLSPLFHDISDAVLEAGVANCPFLLQLIAAEERVLILDTPLSTDALLDDSSLRCDALLEPGFVDGAVLF